jgi:hypothetical protein
MQAAILFGPGDNRVGEQPDLAVGRTFLTRSDPAASGHQTTVSAVDKWDDTVAVVGEHHGGHAPTGGL